MSIETIMNAMFSPPDAAPEVVTLDRVKVEAILAELEAADPLRSIVSELRALLAAPKMDLWITYSHGPNQTHPFLSKEAAESDVAETIKLCTAVAEREGWADEFVMPSISVLPSPWPPAEHYRYVAEDALERLEGLSATYRKADDDRSKLLAAAAHVVEHFTPAHMANSGDSEGVRVLTLLADAMADVTAEEVARRKRLEDAEARHKANVERLRASSESATK